MRFSTAAIFAFVSAVVAQNPTADFDPIHTPTEDQAVVAGSTVDITWDYLPKYNGTVTIVLIGGPDVPHQVTVATLASKLDNSLGKYSWVVDKTLGAAKVYGIQINYDADPTIFQWGFHFSITGGASTSGTGSASVSVPTTTASTSGSTSYSASTPATTTLTSVTTSAYPTTTVSSIIDSSPVGGGVSTTTAPAGNLSTTAGPSKTTAATTTGPSTIPNAGAALAASSFALVGCLAAAVLAL